MKAVIGLLAIIVSLLASCTMQLGATAHTKGRVVISSTRAANRALLSHPLRVHHPATVSHSPTARSVALPLVSRHASLARTIATRPSNKSAGAVARGLFAKARDLSASTDIQSMSYTVTNLDPQSGEAAITGSIDPTWPYIDLFLTPGGSYRIVVSVIPTSTAPGAALGVTQFGDQADFTVDWFDDTYVDLFVHATSMPIFRPESYSSGAVTGYYADGTTNPITENNLLPSSLSKSSGDQFIYGPDPKLYYFNQGANTIYQWTSISATGSVCFSTSSSTAYDTTGTSTVSLTSIAAFASDPYWSSYLYILAMDTSNNWGIYTIDTSSGPGTAYEWFDLTADMEDSTNSLGPTNEHPTGLAVDLSGNVYVSFNTYDATNSYAGVLQYDYYGNLIGGYPFSFNTSLYSTTYYTDVAVLGGAVLVSATPVFVSTYGSGGTISLNTGDAQIVGLDTFMNPVSVDDVAYGTAMLAQPGSGTLWAPARFEALGSDGQIYFTQNAWGTPGWTVTPRFSSITTDLTTVVDHP